MNKIDTRIKELGIILPKPSPPMAALLRPTRIIADRLIVSAQTPKLDGKLTYCGKVGEHFSLVDAQAATRLCMLNVLAHAKEALEGNLDQVKAVVVVRGYINVTPQFTKIAESLNGASEVLLQIFGEQIGSHTRTAVGATSMPFGVAAEVEAEFWISRTTSTPY